MSTRALDQDRLQNSHEGFLWLLDCTLATVEMLAMKKNPPSVEYSRQVGMAQTAMDCLIREGKDISIIRAGEIVEKFNRSVKAWADSIHARFYP